MASPSPLHWCWWKYQLSLNSLAHWYCRRITGYSCTWYSDIDNMTHLPSTGKMEKMLCFLNFSLGLRFLLSMLIVSTLICCSFRDNRLSLAAFVAAVFQMQNNTLGWISFSNCFSFQGDAGYSSLIFFSGWPCAYPLRLQCRTSELMKIHIMT